jgi:hypothetical protein
MAPIPSQCRISECTHPQQGIHLAGWHQPTAHTNHEMKPSPFRMRNRAARGTERQRTTLQVFPRNEQVIVEGMDRNPRNPAWNPTRAGTDRTDWGANPRGARSRARGRGRGGGRGRYWSGRGSTRGRWCTRRTGGSPALPSGARRRRRAPRRRGRGRGRGEARGGGSCSSMEAWWRREDEAGWDHYTTSTSLALRYRYTDRPAITRMVVLLC